MIVTALVLFLTNNLPSLLLWSAVFLLIRWLLRQPTNLPPGPTWYPLLGSLDFFGERPYKVFWRCFQQYGGIATLYLGTRRCILLTDIDLIKKADAVCKRSLLPVVAWTLGYEGSLVFGSGHEWKKRKRFTMQALRGFGLGKKSLDCSINEEARSMMELFSEKKGTPFNPSDIITYAIVNVSCKLTFGKSFGFNDPEVKAIKDKFNLVFNSFQIANMWQIFPYLLRTPVCISILKNLLELKEYFLEKLSTHSESLDENDVRDIIDLYLLEIKRQQESGDEVLFRPEQAWRLIFELFGGGIDPTTNTILFAIMLTSLHPEVQNKVQEEIDAVIGTSRQPSYRDRSQMPYTEAVLLEVQRFRPFAGVAPNHEVVHDTQLAGYNIPKGSQVFYNIWGLLHDPKLWKNPHQFDPTNFLSEDGSAVLRPVHFIPFGTGHRSCIGENLAKTELFLFVTNLFQRFTFTLPENEPTPSTDPAVGLGTRPQKFRICATPR